MAARTLEEMVEKGYKKMRRKLEIMKKNWEAAKDRMIKHYKELPFPSWAKELYEEGVREATISFNPEKWKENFKAKMGGA